MNKIFPHIHTKKVWFVLNYCSKRYNHVVKRNLPLTGNLLPRVWLYSTAYLEVSQSLDSIAQRKRTTDRRCKLLQRPPFISISSLTPMRGPLVTAAISGRPAPLLETLSTAAGGGVITLCFPHGHHHTARWTPRQDSVKPLGPLTLSAASRCLCSALEPSRFLTVALLEGLCEWMHCFISSCVNRNGPLPFLHFTPWLSSAVVYFTTSRTPHGFREAAVFTWQRGLLSTDHMGPAREDRSSVEANTQDKDQGCTSEYRVLVPPSKSPRELMPPGALQEAGCSVCSEQTGISALKVANNQVLFQPPFLWHCLHLMALSRTVWVTDYRQRALWRQQSSRQSLKHSWARCENLGQVTAGFVGLRVDCIALPRAQTSEGAAMTWREVLVCGPGRFVILAY